MMPPEVLSLESRGEVPLPVGAPAVTGIYHLSSLPPFPIFLSSPHTQFNISKLASEGNQRSNDHLALKAGCVSPTCAPCLTFPLWGGAQRCAHKWLIFLPIRFPTIPNNLKLGCSWNNKQRHLAVPRSPQGHDSDLTSPSTVFPIFTNHVGQKRHYQPPAKLQWSQQLSPSSRLLASLRIREWKEEME